MRPARAAKPLLFGYYSGRRTLSADQLVGVNQRITAFAENEGYVLAGVFVEVAVEPAVGLQAMLQSARRREGESLIEAVVVSAESDLGGDEITQRATRQRLEAVGLRVLVLAGGGHC